MYLVIAPIFIGIFPGNERLFNPPVPDYQIGGDLVIESLRLS